VILDYLLSNSKKLSGSLFSQAREETYGVIGKGGAPYISDGKRESLRDI